MRTILIIISMVTLLTGPTASQADEAVITLKDLEQEALKNNPEIGMAGKRAESAEEKKSLAAAMPDPMIGYAIQNVGALGTSTVGKEQMSMQGWVVTQEIPFPGKLSTKGSAARKIAEREQDNAGATRLKVLSDLRNAYYDYYLAYRSLDILGQNKEIMKNFERVAETRYSTGQGLQQDVLRAQIEVSMLIERIAMEEQKLETTRATINGLVGRDPRSALGRPADVLAMTFPMGLDQMSTMALEHSPMLDAKKRMVEESEFELSLSKREFLPDMEVSVGWFTRGDFQDVWQASVMLKVPLYFWNKSTGVRAASADLHSAHYEYEASKLALLTRVQNLYSMAKTSEHHIHLYESGIIPQARLALQSATSNYQVGKIDFLSLLENETVLLKYQLAYEEQLVNLNKTMAMISEVIGENHE
ncbi:MAG TPA: TolC family protein [Nitrospirota bacterium]|nr:TolC family protein [Nitrospirota bacterium]